MFLSVLFCFLGRRPVASVFLSPEVEDLCELSAHSCRRDSRTQSRITGMLGVFSFTSALSREVTLTLEQTYVVEPNPIFIFIFQINSRSCGLPAYVTLLDYLYAVLTPDVLTLWISFCLVLLITSISKTSATVHTVHSYRYMLHV